MAQPALHHQDTRKADLRPLDRLTKRRHPRMWRFRATDLRKVGGTSGGETLPVIDENLCLVRAGTLEKHSGEILYHHELSQVLSGRTKRLQSEHAGHSHDAGI